MTNPVSITSQDNTCVRDIVVDVDVELEDAIADLADVLSQATLMAASEQIHLTKGKWNMRLFAVFTKLDD